MSLSPGRINIIIKHIDYNITGVLPATDIEIILLFEKTVRINRISRLILMMSSKLNATYRIELIMCGQIIWELLINQLKLKVLEFWRFQLCISSNISGLVCHQLQLWNVLYLIKWTFNLNIKPVDIALMQKCRILSMDHGSL
jgi:hypothetical protein